MLSVFEEGAGKSSFTSAGGGGARLQAGVGGGGDPTAPLLIHIHPSLVVCGQTSEQNEDGRPGAPGPVFYFSPKSCCRGFSRWDSGNKTLFRAPTPANVKQSAWQPHPEQLIGHPEWPGAVWNGLERSRTVQAVRDWMEEGCFGTNAHISPKM